MDKAARFEIRIAGFGGQGVITIGRILGTAFSVYQGKNSVNTQSYGPESRGGACRSEVVVSDGDINYPYVRRADIFIALSQTALDTYLGDLKEGGILLIDPQAIDQVPRRERYRTYAIPTMEIARQTGGVKFQNSAALGALFPLIEEVIEEAALKQALTKNVPPKTVDANLKAFELGREYVRQNYDTGR
jgi:2-oxoglutarate ferredoxin oxidoreductase subunit gamma